MSYSPADLGEDGTAEAAVLKLATYDESTRWPNVPPSFAFDPEGRGALRV